MLELDYNDMDAVSGLSSLTNLTRLYLGFNHITDISGLTGLVNLEELDLRNNQITDVSSLERPGLYISGSGHQR